jgi:hypothetical protein
LTLSPNRTSLVLHSCSMRTPTSLVSTVLLLYSLLELPVLGSEETYLLLLHSSVVPINTCQSLCIPPELVVAGVCVDDGRAVVASSPLGGAFGVRLCGGNA